MESITTKFFVRSLFDDSWLFEPSIAIKYRRKQFTDHHAAVMNYQIKTFLGHTFTRLICNFLANLLNGELSNLQRQSTFVKPFDNTSASRSIPFLVKTSPTFQYQTEKPDQYLLFTTNFCG